MKEGAEKNEVTVNLITKFDPHFSSLPPENSLVKLDC